MPKYIYDGIGLIEVVDVEIEQLIEVICSNCSEGFPICHEEWKDPEGYDIRCPKCGERWLPFR